MTAIRCRILCKGRSRAFLDGVTHVFWYENEAYGPFPLLWLASLVQQCNTQSLDWKIKSRVSFPVYIISSRKLQGFSTSALLPEPIKSSQATAVQANCALAKNMLQHYVVSFARVRVGVVRYSACTIFKLNSNGRYN